MNTEVSGRSLLLRLGVSDFNATMMIPYLFTSAMTTDPKSPQIILMVKHMQKVLNQMGGNLYVTGYLDRPTSAALSGLFATQSWSSWAWADIIAAILRAKAQGLSIAEVPPITTHELAATGDMPFGLPDVPGGVLTYAAAAGLLWYTLKRKRA